MQSSSPHQVWSWRQRARDPRLAGILVLAAAVAAFLAGAVFGGSWERRLLGVVVVVVVVAVMGLVGLVKLPPWRDPQRGLASAAGVFCVVAVVVAIAGILVQ